MQGKLRPYCSRRALKPRMETNGNGFPKGIANGTISLTIPLTRPNATSGWGEGKGALPLKYARSHYRTGRLLILILIVILLGLGSWRLRVRLRLRAGGNRSGLIQRQ